MERRGPRAERAMPDVRAPGHEVAHHRLRIVLVSRKGVLDRRKQQAAASETRVVFRGGHIINIVRRVGLEPPSHGVDVAAPRGDPYLVREHHFFWEPCPGLGVCLGRRLGSLGTS